jgi:hypothetical protein
MKVGRLFSMKWSLVILLNVLMMYGQGDRAL